MKEQQTDIYFIAGLGANSSIFENLKFPDNKYKLHFINWLMPTDKRESIYDYASRMSKKITVKNPIIIGVSFGGVIAQEIAKQISAKHLIIISSIKQRSELPKLFLAAKKTKTYKLLPIKLLKSDYFVKLFFKLLFGSKAVKRTNAVKKYLTITDTKYINWSIDHLLNWKQEKPIPNTIHIHGSKDEIFPIKNIENCFIIKNGTHAMIITKSKQISAKILDVIS